MDILIGNYVTAQIEHLIDRNKCCIHWFGPFCNEKHNLTYKAAQFGFKTSIIVINGHCVTKIYTSACNHIVHQPSSFKLTKQSQRDILHHFKKIEVDSFQLETLISPQIFIPARQKPVLPPNRFTIGPHRQTIYHSNAASKQSIQESWRIYPFKADILKIINKNRIVVINGDATLEQSTAVPMFIVEDSTASGSYCKILCVESDNLSAITHCTVLANYIKERIGSRVGFQVYLQSRVCDNTNLIYTTAVFFLRVLMGQNPKDSFRHVSHIVVSNVHLHHAYTDILLYELKNVLPFYPQIKIILLSNGNENAKLLSYFGEGEELQIDLSLPTVELYYIEEINLITDNDQGRNRSKPIVENVLPIVAFSDNLKMEWADKALEEYVVFGSDVAFSRFLYLVNAGYISIDYSHSRLGCTALIAAAKLGKSLDLNRLLTCESANPFVEDTNKLNALKWAISNNNMDCANILLRFMDENVYKNKPPPIDFGLINKLIQMITTSWKFGHILIFLPTFEDLLKLNYGILKLQFIGKIPQEISVFLLHSNMQYDQLQPIIADSMFVKIILATTVAESISYLNDITYVIDTGLNCIERYNPKSKCKESVNEWASKEALERRSTIAGRFTSGHCFRLIPRKLVNKLRQLTTPELVYVPMNRISLTAKLLCPHKMVAEYFQQTIVKPPQVHVRHSVECLKTIEVFDCVEGITWLGCRLIDVPVDVELGKSLVLSILLKCLDPVLTIISFLTCTDSMEITKCKNYTAVENILQKKENISVITNGLHSDHLTLLRLYQAWQNNKRENTINDILSDENTYVTNGILDKVCGIRTHLVGALRSSQLIHNQGQLSMHSINSKANNWAIIKAALTGGLYPKLCMVDRTDQQLKSKYCKLFIHPSSTLREAKNGTSLHQRYPSDWIVFFRETNGVIVNNISNCTLISPVTIALFAGRTELDPKNLVFPKPIDREHISGNAYAAFYIDEWICLTTDTNSAILLYKLRQRFYAAYMDFLQTCGNSERWRKPNTTVSEIPRILDVLSKILLEEDMSLGFTQPNRVGNRPKAVANKFSSNFDSSAHPTPFSFQRNMDIVLSNRIHYRCLDKEFFLINVFDSHEIMKSMGRLPMLDISGDSLFEAICSSASLQKLTYVIVCSINRKQFTNIALVKCKRVGFSLRNCFQISIPVCEVIIMCTLYKLTLPPLRADWNPQKLDNNVGEIILKLL